MDEEKRVAWVRGLRKTHKVMLYRSHDGIG